MDPYQELTLYQRSAALMAAAKLGVFAALGEGPATPSEVAGLVAAPGDSIASVGRSRGARDMSRDGERFALNDFSKELTHDGAAGMARLAWKEHLFYLAWGRLADAISSDSALFPSFADRVAKDFPSVENYCRR